MANPGILARQTLNESLQLDKETVDKRYGPLRPGPQWLRDQQWLVKLADDAEDLLREKDKPNEDSTLLTGVWDFLLGKKPDPLPKHTPAEWAVARPRPHRGKSADPSVAEKASAEIRNKQALEEAAAAGAAEAAKAAEAEKQEDAAALLDMQNLDFAASQTQQRRLGFFGRPAQKLRIAMMGMELVRRAHEHQAEMWAHLMSDAQEEYDIREKMYKEEKHKKNEAASAAASWRAQEKGAAAAAKGLSIGAALKAGMLAAKAAEKRYRENAEEQESISRKAKVAEEAAYELMQQEAEKVHICEKQIKMEKITTLGLFTEIGKLEEAQLLALVAEENVLKDFKSVWEKKISTLAMGTPARDMAQNCIDEYDLRLDVVDMEKKMYVPTYIQRAPPAKDNPQLQGKDADLFDTFHLRPTPPGAQAKLALSWRSEPKQIKWIEIKQPAKGYVDSKGKATGLPVIGLGKGVVGPPLKFRKKIVQTKGAGEFAAMKEYEHLLEEACDDIHKYPIVLDTIMLEEPNNPFGLYVSREDKERDPKAAPGTQITSPVFCEKWKQWDASPCRTKQAKEQTHNPSFDKQATQCFLRHKPVFKWCCQWIVDDDKARKSLLKNSYVLGPEKKPYLAIVAPKFHNGDEITNMSRYGRIAEWRVQRYDGDDNNSDMRVQKNLPLVAFRIYDPELVSSKNPNGRWPPYEYTFYPGDDARSLKEKAALDKALKEFACPKGSKVPLGEWIDDEDTTSDCCKNDKPKNKLKEPPLKEFSPRPGPKIFVFNAKKEGKLTGIVRDPGSKVISGQDICWLDVGDDDWNTTILPVAEWPPEFFS